MNDDDETDELYMELLQRDTTISELNQRIDEIESENENLKRIIETLTVVKRKRGDDVSCINCSIIESIVPNQSRTLIPKALRKFSSRNSR